MTEPTTPRPRQVTLAGWMIMVGSALVVALVFEQLIGLRSLETRETVESFLSEPPVSDLDIGVEGVLQIMWVLGMVAAACATAAAILGYQVLRRSRSARLVLTVLAGPLFLAGMVTGGFVPAVVAASAVMLWLQPARDWFRDAPSSLGSSSTQGFSDTPRPLPEPTRMPTVPAAFRAQPGPPPQPQPTHPDLPPRVWPTPYTGPAMSRPAAVGWACLLTWICCGVTAAGAALSAIAFVLDPDVVIDGVRRQSPELAEQGVTDTLLMATTYAMLAFVVLWCVAATVVAILTFRRIGWARIVLVVSASVTAAVSLLGSAMGGFLLVFPLIASIIVIVLLLRPDVRVWYDARDRLRKR